jgi:hypothetical protein
MTAYLLVLILGVGIPFLLYCLWNFARDLRPHRSAAVLSTPLTRTKVLRTRPASRIGSRSQVASLRHEGRAAS